MFLASQTLPRRKRFPIIAVRISRMPATILFLCRQAARRPDLFDVSNRLNQLNQQLTKLPPPQQVYAAANDFKPDGSLHPPKTPRAVFLLPKGDVKRPGELMQPAGIAAVPGPNPNFNQYAEEISRDTLTPSSPSPRPSPSGRGSDHALSENIPGHDPPTERRGSSLSPGERAGVRGNAATENTISPND